MTIGFTKLFATILDSSIWSEDDKTRIVWITMLAMSDQNGYIESSLPGLAHNAHVSLEDCQKALEKFLAPDPFSRSTDHEGRRIEKVEGGWKLVNHKKYRDKMSALAKREYFRVKKQEYRQKERDLNKGLSAQQIINRNIAAEKSGK